MRMPALCLKAICGVYEYIGAHNGRPCYRQWLPQSIPAEVFGDPFSSGPESPVAISFGIARTRNFKPQKRIRGVAF